MKIVERCTLLLMASVWDNVLGTCLCIKLVFHVDQFLCCCCRPGGVPKCWALYGRMSIIYFCGACWSGVCGCGLVNVNCSESQTPTILHRLRVYLLSVRISSLFSFFALKCFLLIRIAYEFTCGMVFGFTAVQILPAFSILAKVTLKPFT